MGDTRSCVTGALIGAGLMYAFDPIAGRRRRALFWDQMHRLARKSARAIDVASRDLQNRARGMACEAEATLIAGRPTDAVLVQRVRTKAGRYLRHPSALEVDVSRGCVVLRGPVLADEAERLVAAVRGVRGVCGVEDQLEIHQTPDIPALQGEGRRRGSGPGDQATNWSPAARLIAGGLGGVLLANCLAKRSTGAMLGGLAGACLLSRAASNAGLGENLGLSRGAGTAIQKAVEIDAPIETVFDFFSDPRNLARVSDVVTSVQKRDDGHFTKQLTLAGLPLRFEERIVSQDTPSAIEIASEPGSMLSYDKSFRFDRLAGGGTRVTLRFHYDPPAGAIGEAAASALGYDPRTLFSDLLMRSKSFLETGRQPHDAAQHDVTQHDGAPGGEHTQAASTTKTRDDAQRREQAWPHATSQLPPAV